MSEAVFTQQPAKGRPRQTGRWILLILVLVVSHLAALAAGYILARVVMASGPPSEPGNRYVTRENFAAIKVGMTYAEVQELFGDKGQVVSGSVTGDGEKRKREVAW